MLKNKFIILTICLLAFYSGLYGQSYGLVVHVSEEDKMHLPKDFEFARYFGNVQDLDLDLKEEVLQWRRRSFLSANIDSAWALGAIRHVRLYIGAPVKMASFQIENVPQEVLYKIGLGEQGSIGQLASSKSVSKRLSEIIEYYENHGYPFAELLVSEKKMISNGLKLGYRLVRNDKYVFDTISIKGTAGISKKFLGNLLGFNPGDDYNEQLVKSIDKKLSTLPFVDLARPMELYFNGGLAHIVLHANKRKSDRIDGLIGIAPRSSNKSGDLLVTGEVNLELMNLFQSAKQLELHWKSFLERSQKLNLKVGVPYVFSSPVGLNLDFNMLKSDTFFLNLNAKLEGEFIASAENRWSVYYEQRNTYLISADTNAVRARKVLPIYNPTKTNYYGLSFKRQRLDYVFNPRKGFETSLTGAVGRKQIVKDNRIKRVVFSENGSEYNLYDSVKNLKDMQYKVSFFARKFFPLKRSSTLLIGLESESVVADRIFVNEQIRLGGFANLRGFDEESIFATTYVLFNLEYRYLLSRNSFLQAFFNGAYIKDELKENSKEVEDYPYGFGAGFSFDTQGGIFNIAYAVGSQQGNPLDFRVAKVHFGLKRFF